MFVLLEIDVCKKVPPKEFQWRENSDPFRSFVINGKVILILSKQCFITNYLIIIFICDFESVVLSSTLYEFKLLLTHSAKDSKDR